ncbi:hypothetical protein D3C78_1815140 [compost metagenome]
MPQPGLPLHNLPPIEKLCAFNFENTQQHLRRRRKIGVPASEHDDGAFHRGFLEHDLAKMRYALDVFKCFPG